MSHLIENALHLTLSISCLNKNASYAILSMSYLIPPTLCLEANHENGSHLGLVCS